MASTTCYQVVVRAQVKTQSGTYYQKGAGIVYSENNQGSSTKIVIPSHVVYGANKVVAICGGKEIPLEILGQSVTADLAVGKIKDVKAETFFSPLFFLSGQGTHPYFAAFSLENGAEIWVPSENGDRKIITANYVFTYTPRFMNPIFSDLGAKLTSSGVIPGMSGSALVFEKSLVGIITKSFSHESLSAAIPVKDILTLIPFLEKGVDPYLAGPLYLTNELVENVHLKTLSRLHRLHLKTPQGWVVFKDICESSSWSATSSWIPESGGWGEGGGGWGEGSGPGTNQNSAKNVLIEGLRLPTPEEKAKGVPALPVAYYLSRKYPCQREGLFSNVDGRRLVGLLNYPEKSGKALTTLRINSVDDLMPVVVDHGSSILEYINKYGIFAEQSVNSINDICDSKPFKNSDTLVGTALTKLEIVESSGARSYFYKENLAPTDKETLDDEGKQNKTILSCDPKNKALHFKAVLPEIPLTFNLKISAQFIDGLIQLGSCQMKIPPTAKDFWHAEINSQDMDFGFDFGISITGNGTLKLTPRRISEKCFNGASLNSKTSHLREFIWMAE
ncbi:MAG: hypothetical protein ACXVCY_17005 [Pseudobdellovibrionaceae bacterium]